MFWCQRGSWSNSLRENPKIEYYEETYRQHSAIFDAIRKGNPDLAEKAAQDSVKDGLMKVLFALSQSMNKLSGAPLTGSESP